MVEGLTEHVLIAAMYATASASRLWEDRPSPPLAQAAQDVPDTGPTAEDIHQILNMRAPPKTHPQVRPIQLVSWDAMDAPPTTAEVHILKHRDTCWTVEWDDNNKVRRATAHAPADEVPPPPRGGDRLRLAARVPHAPEAAWEALHYALYWAQGAPEGPLPPERTPAWTRHATCYTAHMRRHRAGTGHRLLTWPTDPPDALQEAEEVLGLMTKQVFKLKDPVPTSKPDVPAARETPCLHRATHPYSSPRAHLPNEDNPLPGAAKVRRSAIPPQRPNRRPSQEPSRRAGPKRKPLPCIPNTPSVPGCSCPSSTPRPRAPPSGYGPQGRSSTGTSSPGTTMGSRSTSSVTRPPPTTRRWGAPSNSGETEPVVRWSPCSCAPPTRSTSLAPSTRAKSTMHGPYPSPRSGTARHPQLRASSTSSTPDGTRAGHGPPPQLSVPRNRHLQKPTPASTSSTSLRSPTTPPRPPHCKPCPGHAPKSADLLGFLEQALRRADQPKPAPILDPEGNKYHAHWQRGVPLYHKTSVTVHAHPDLGVDGRLGAYECVEPRSQLNVLLTHVPFGEETKDFLDTPSLAYRRLPLLAPTIIIGDLNAAPTDEDRTGPTTATNIAVRDAMHQLGLTDLTTGLTGTPSHYPHQAGTHPSRIETCYGDPTTVRIHEAAYGDLPPTGMGHRPLYNDLIIPDLPPPAATLPDDTLPPTLQFPAEDDHGAWHRYNRALHAILRRPDAPTLTTAMRRAAQACGMERDTSDEGAPPDLTFQQLVHDIWTTKEELATLLRPSTPEAERDRDAHLRALLSTCRHQLQEWHANRIAAAAQESERYGRNDMPYQSLRYVSRILEDTGRRTINAVRDPEGGLTNDPDAVIQAVLDSFQAQHGDALPELDPHTRNTIREHVPRVFNREQRRAIKHDPFSISELQRALERLKKGVVPGVDGLPAEAYQRLTLPVKQRLAARLWDIVTGATHIPPEWANLVHPLYKKANWAQPGNWRPIVCVTTEVKLVWTLILGRIVLAVFAHVPASMRGAMAGRSPHEAIFLQDTALDINPYEMIIASLDVQGAFPHAPHRLLTEVWDAMGLPFLSFMTGYIQTRLYAVITAAGLTPWTGTDSGVPQGGAEGPFLYLLVTLPLAFELAQVYPVYAPYPLRSPLINFADDNLLTTATRHREPENAGLPTTTEQASAILQLTTTYLDAHQLLVHPRKSVRLADARTPTPHIREGEPLHPEDTTVHLGVTQATRHHHITLPSKLEERLARLPQIARGDLLSTQGLAYFMEAVLNAAIGYQALHLPRPKDALRHARQQVTKAWAQHGGWPTSFPKEAMMAHCRYYGDNTGALVDMAYAKHGAHLLHRVTHNHQPEVREAAAIRIKEAQMARNTCPRWILAQHGVSASVGTGIWA